MNTQYNFDPLEHLPAAFKEQMFNGLIQEWFMTETERPVLIAVLDRLKPEVSIEVGTAGGGSLSVLAN